MLKTIIRIIIAGFLAWFLKPVLIHLIPFPTENMVEGLLDLQNPEDQAALFLFRFLVWTFLIYVIIRYVRPLLFGFILPTTHRYAPTKPLRRLQGVMAEVTLLGTIFFLFCTVFAIWPFRKIFNQEVEQTFERSVQDSLQALEISRDTLLSFLQNVAKTGNTKILEANIPTTGGLVPVPIAQGGGKSADYIIRYGIDPDVWFTVPPDETTVKFSDRSDYLLLDIKLGRNSTFNKIFRENFITGVFRQYDEFENIIKTGIARYEYADSTSRLLAASLEGSTSSNPIIPKYQSQARKVAWSEFKQDPFPLVAKAYTRAAPIAIIIALIIYGLSHLPIRYDIAGRYVGILRFFEQGRFGFGGSARFAGLVEEWATLYKNQTHGLYMGRSLYNPFLNIGLEDSRHMLTIAGSRAGKGTTAIIPNLLLWEGSALVIDPKGTNAAVTIRRRREMGHNVYLVDPFNLVTDLGETSASFNPLAHLDPESPWIREQISSIAEALVVRQPEQKDAHWDDGAKTIIAGMIAHMISWPEYNNPALPQLRDMVSQMPEEQVELWADMSLNPGAGRLAMDAAMRVIRGGQTNEILSILSNVDKHTEWLSSPAMQNVLNTSSFSFAELKEKPTTIYLILPPDKLETHKRFLRLFINLAISQMAIGGRSKIPVLLLMDEFLALGRMEEVEKAYGLMAGYNLVLWPFVQDFGRLKDLYKSSVNAFITNSRAVQVFGVFDEETTTFVSNQIGYRNLSSFSGNAKDKTGVMLRAPNEVSIDIAADTGRQYILRAGKAPFLLEKVPYYEGKLFEGKYDQDPDYA